MDQKYAIEKINSLTGINTEGKESIVDAIKTAGIERLCDYIVDLASQKVALLAACKRITKTSTECHPEYITMQTALGQALQHMNFYKDQLKGVVEQAQSAIEQAGESGK